MILVVGKHFKGLKDHLQANNIDQFLLLDEQIDEKHAIKLGVPYIKANFETIATVKTIITKLPKNITAVITVYENYILPASWLAELLKANGLPIKSAEACTDKDLMRQLFSYAPESISPDFTVVKSIEDLKEFMLSHKYPVVLKPANLAKSLMVTTCYSEKELYETYMNNMEVIDNIYKKYAPNRVPKLIVEEFLKGSVHSVDGFVDGYGKPHILDVIVDYKTGYDIGYNDNFHYSRVIPSSLSAEQQKQLKHVAELGVKALGMKYSAAHIEIIMTKNRPKIVEIGARNGGYRPRMHKIANNIDIYKQLLNTLTDKPIDVKAKNNDGCAVLELFPKKPGVFSEIANEDKLRKLKSFKYLSLKTTPGEDVGLSSQGFKACAVIILHHKDIEQFREDLAYVTKNIIVATE